MVSRPSAKRGSVSVENTGSSSPSAGSRNAAKSSGAEISNGVGRAVDLLVAVSEREEHRLVLRRCDVDAAVEQTAEKRGIRIDVGRKERRHRADARDAAVTRESVLEAPPTPLQLLVELRHAQAAQDGEPGSRRQRIPRERPRLIDGARGSELLHHVGAPAERGEGQPTADDLPEDG